MLDRSARVVDDTLLAKLRARDPEVLRTIFVNDGRRLYRAARGMGVAAEDAEDVVHDVFVTFITSLDRFEGRAQLSTWLFGILHHKVQERRRVRVRAELHDPIDAIFEAQFDDAGSWRQPPVAPDRSVGVREAAAAIGHCLEGLSPSQRDVFQLRDVEGLSAADVSKILGQTVTHVGVLLYRARLRLRECLGAKGWGGTRR
jgi:RNA polymerase sigma-70 factor (ECF subfamily)